MKYPDGQDVRLGDRLQLWEGEEGIVVCSIDTGEFSERYPEVSWSYLEKGVLIESPGTGLMHYTEPEWSFRLLSRRSPG